MEQTIGFAYWSRRLVSLTPASIHNPAPERRRRREHAVVGAVGGSGHRLLLQEHRGAAVGADVPAGVGLEAAQPGAAAVELDLQALVDARDVLALGGVGGSGHRLLLQEHRGAAVGADV